MLYISLILSLLLLCLFYGLTRYERVGRLAFFLAGIGFSFGLACLGVFLPPVALLFVFLCISFVIWTLCSRRRRVLLALTCVSVVATSGITAWSVAEDQHQMAQLRKEFPYQSMEDRVPEPRPSLRPKVLPAQGSLRVGWLEKSLREDGMRAYMLKKLHEDAVSLFVNSPGFGVTRMFRPYRAILAMQWKPDRQVQQPEPQNDAVWSADGGKWAPFAGADQFSPLHEGAILDFANADGFGYIKDRRHVAGFQPHRMSEVPGPADSWQVQRVDLVGLLLHDEPVAYVSALLPRMDTLHGTPVRALDRFETSSLEKLREGEDLVVGSAPGRLRMLGAIRSLKQCVSCHGGERGDLLGAFSYRLQRKEP